MTGKDERLVTSNSIMIFDDYRTRHGELLDLTQEKGQAPTDISDWTQDDLKKIVFAGIKFICSWGRFKKENVRLDTNILEPLEFSKEWISVMHFIFDTATYLSLESFIELFPVKNNSKGDKREIEDSKNVLSGMDLDKPIGTRVQLFKLLGNYRNSDIKTAYKMYISAEIDSFRAKQGEKKNS